MATQLCVTGIASPLALFQACVDAWRKERDTSWRALDTEDPEPSSPCVHNGPVSQQSGGNRHTLPRPECNSSPAFGPSGDTQLPSRGTGKARHQLDFAQGTLAKRTFADCASRRRSEPPPHTEKENVPLPTTTTTNNNNNNGGGGILYNEVLRRKQDRKLLHGTACPCCSDYYRATRGAQGPQPRTEAAGVAALSRHRYQHIPPATPPGYWDVGFTPTE